MTYDTIRELSAVGCHTSADEAWMTAVRGGGADDDDGDAEAADEP